MKHTLLYVTLIASGLALGGCLGNQSSSSNTTGNTSATITSMASSKFSTFPPQVVTNPKSLNSNLTFRDTITNTATYENPVLGYLGSRLSSIANEQVEGLMWTGINDLFGDMGINIFQNPEDAEFAQIEAQLTQIENSIATLNNNLTSFINTYNTNTSNAYQQNFAQVNTDVANYYSNLGQDIYNNEPNNSTLTNNWEAGIIPAIPAETAALTNSTVINNYLNNFPAGLSQDINMLSDDSSDSYLDANGNLLVTENADGTWSSTRAQVQPGAKMFYNALHAAYNEFVIAHSAYPNASQNTQQNYLLSKAQWTQIVMTALFNTTVDLQRTYRIVDFIVAAKFNQPQQFSNLNLPSFMGNPTSYQQAHVELATIYKYKTFNIMQEAQQMIDQFSTGGTGSDITDYSIPATCDDPLSHSNGAASGQPMSLATFMAQSSNYVWDGKHLTTMCKTNSGNTVVTTQDVVDMCGPRASGGGQVGLISLDSHIYCAAGLNPSQYNSYLNQNISNAGNQADSDLALSNAIYASGDNIIDSVDVRGIDNSTWIPVWFVSSQDHLSWVNDMTNQKHLHDGDPTNSYYVLMQDSERQYIYGEAYNSENLYGVYLMCVPSDSYCARSGSFGNFGGLSFPNGVTLSFQKFGSNSYNITYN